MCITFSQKKYNSVISDTFRMQIYQWFSFNKKLITRTFRRNDDFIPSSSSFYLSNINKVSCTSSKEQTPQITPITQALEQNMKAEVGKYQGLK